MCAKTASTLDLSAVLPGLSIDCVIFGFDRGKLHVLVLKWKNEDLWALPGGFIPATMDIDQAATKILEERTGIRLPYLAQFHTFGKVNRRRIDSFLDQLKGSVLPENWMEEWIRQRFVSIGYLSLVNLHQCRPSPDLFSDACEWVQVKELPPMLFDHQHITEKALEQLRHQINYLPIGLSLLPEKFTMKELQRLYEEVLERKLDRANFQKKMLKLGFLDRQEKQMTGAAHKAPYLYSFNTEAYQELLQKGIGYIS